MWMTDYQINRLRQCHWRKTWGRKLWNEMSTSKQSHMRLALWIHRLADRTIALIPQLMRAQKVFFMKNHHFWNFQNSWMRSNSYVWQSAYRDIFMFCDGWINELMNKILAVVRKMPRENERLIRSKSKSRSKNRNQKGKEVRSHVGKEIKCEAGNPHLRWFTHQWSDLGYIAKLEA